MDMTYLTGRGFTSITTGERDENGNWKVTVEMSEKLSFPNGTIREETIEATHESPDFHTAHKEAMREVLQQLQDVVYSRGFDSLIEGIDYENGLEDGSDNSKTNEASPTE